MTRSEMARSAGLVISGVLFSTVGGRSIDVLQFLMTPPDGGESEDIIFHSELPGADVFESTPLTPSLSGETVLELSALVHGVFHFALALTDAALQYRGHGGSLAARASLVTAGIFLVTGSLVFVAYAYQNSHGDLMR